MDWYTDSLLPENTIAFWDKRAIIMMHGPPRTAEYVDERTHTRGIVVSSPYMFGTPFGTSVGGHIVTENNLGHTIVYCKKMYIRKGKNRVRLKNRPPIVITSEDPALCLCPNCGKYVLLRDEYLDFSWRMVFPMKDHIIREI